ncbi:hypothetical protein BCV69DRAFT_157432 [Microstroma glucosiphilum]|uniref:S-adenosyl-L-methionine-dependent methyltransferase n=1 Tax=Pseudomicrostroma glucosiphilum TaxID=1684307 RepID=A0A316UBM2_9BASI|nr:hypothetical protein BCV69DRAFT_157432 [Pseudomicrostroma glucosiphilum]PWN21851.1 hypothetical protein BCV69DRAFT_157432 [Pseudomicrostroma glucosiphilum]
MGKGKSRGTKAHPESQSQDQSSQQCPPELEGGWADASGPDESAEEEAALYDAAKVVNRPAYDTKHLDVLQYNVPELNLTLTLHQSSTTHSTSSSLWLSSQVLAAYLLHTPRYARNPRRGALAVELGAGVGFLSVLLAHMGWDVRATDLPEVLRGVMKKNGRENAVLERLGMKGRMRRRELDWEQWTGTVEEVQRLTSSASDSSASSSSSSSSEEENAPSQDEARRINLVLATDTLYVPHLVEPFWRTFSSLLTSSSSSSGSAVQAELQPELQPETHGLVALERRDSPFITSSLEAAQRFGLQLTRVSQKKLRRIVRDALKWEEEVWCGVEIWEVKVKVKEEQQEQQ